MCDSRDSRYMSIHLTARFIDKYRGHECLWKLKSPDYLNRGKKKEAMEDLVDLCKEEFPRADVMFVKSRIYSLRNAFRKEYRKVKATRAKGGDHQPKLWYFKSLLFTVENNPSPSRGSDLDIDESSMQYDNDLEELDLKPDAAELQMAYTPRENKRSMVDEISNLKEESNVKKANFSSNNEDVLNGYPEMVRSQLRAPAEPTPQPHCSHIQDVDIVYVQSQLRNMADHNVYVEKLKAEKQLAKEEDELNAYSKVVQSKLRNMDPDQKLYAENLINQVLFKGLMNQLTANHEIKDSGVIYGNE